MGKVLGWVVAWFGRNLLSMFGGWKALFGVAFMGIGAIVLYNFTVDLVQEVLQWVVGKIQVETGSLPSVALQATGLGAWLLARLKIAECMSLFCSVLLMKWTLRKIPFLRW